MYTTIGSIATSQPTPTTSPPGDTDQPLPTPNKPQLPKTDHAKIQVNGKYCSNIIYSNT